MTTISRVSKDSKLKWESSISLNSKKLYKIKSMSWEGALLPLIFWQEPIRNSPWINSLISRMIWRGWKALKKLRIRISIVKYPKLWNILNTFIKNIVQNLTIHTQKKKAFRRVYTSFTKPELTERFTKSQRKLNKELASTAFLG